MTEDIISSAYFPPNYEGVDAGQSHLILCSKLTFDGQKSRSEVSFRRIRNNFPDFSMSKSLLPLGFVGLRGKGTLKIRRESEKQPKIEFRCDSPGCGCRMLHVSRHG